MSTTLLLRHDVTGYAVEPTHAGSDADGRELYHAPLGYSVQS